MTTSGSPLHALKAQSDGIAKMIKAVERGENPVQDVGGKIAASRARGSFKVGIVQDDKLVTVEMTWASIAETSEAALAAIILREMRGVKSS